MNVEDSYEGAVRRLQRLELAGVAIESPPPEASDDVANGGDAERLSQLEELATLACEDNERLEREFGTALQELDDARRESDGLRAELEQSRSQLGEARFEIEQLRAYVASLEQAQSDGAHVATTEPHERAAIDSPFAPSPFATDALDELDYGYPPKSGGKGARYFFVFAIFAAAIVALCVIRPWDRPHAAAVPIEPQAAPSPVVTAPPVAPKLEPAPPASVAPTVPKVAPTVAKTSHVSVAAHKPRASKTRAERRHRKHRSAKNDSVATAKAPVSDSNDPLSGTGL